MTAMELKVNALVMIEIGSAQEQEQGRQMLRRLRDGVYQASTLEDTVDELLEELNLRGEWQYIQIFRTALIQGYQRPSLMDCATRGIYQTVGGIYGVTASEVGRCIYRCIEVAYRRGDRETLNRFFRHQVSTVTGAPTPVNFLRRCLKELGERMQVVPA